MLVLLPPSRSQSNQYECILTATIKKKPRCKEIRVWTMANVVTFPLVVVSILLTQCQCKYVEGQLEEPAQKWVFLARFCFLSQDGKFSYEIEYNLEYAVQKLLLYYDTPNQWPAAYNPSRTCEDRESLLMVENNQIINLTSSYHPADCQVIRLGNNTGKYRCSGNRT